MAEETKPTETNAQQVQSTPTEAAKTGERTYSEAEVQQLIKDRLEREKHKRDDEAKVAAEKAASEAAAKNGEWEKVAKAHEAENEKLKAQLKAKDIVDLKRTVAEKIGIPSALASRLTGETQEEIETDAKALLETLPKPTNTKPAPGVTATNPGANGQQAETMAQKRARLLGTGVNPFDADTAKKFGGGVYFSDKEGLGNG